MPMPDNPNPNVDWQRLREEILGVQRRPAPMPQRPRVEVRREPIQPFDADALFEELANQRDVPVNPVREAIPAAGDPGLGQLLAGVAQQRYFIPDPLREDEVEVPKGKGDAYLVEVYKKRSTNLQRQVWRQQNDIRILQEAITDRDKALMNAVSFTRAVNRVLKKKDIKVRLRQPKDQRDLVAIFADLLWYSCKDADPQEVYD